MESSAMERSILTTVLSRSDAEYIQSHLGQSSGKVDSAPIEVCCSLGHADAIVHLEALPES